jgi:acetyltransferase
MDMVPSQPAAQDAAPSVQSWYPVRVQLRDGTWITIRPIGPEDAEREQAFVRGLSPESRYYRFMGTLRELSADMLYRFTHPDFRRDLALAALAGSDPDAYQVGAGQLAVDPDGAAGEFAVMVADHWQNRGVGGRLMSELLRAARALGLKQIWGDILADNRRMLKLMGSQGFDIRRTADPLVRRAVKTTDGPMRPPAAQGISVDAA